VVTISAHVRPELTPLALEHQGALSRKKEHCVWPDTPLVSRYACGRLPIRRCSGVVASRACRFKPQVPSLVSDRDLELWAGRFGGAERCAHLVGHANTRVTELVYRKELRPMLTRGASAMDALFGDARGGRKVSS
jgi:hypothetical protein